MEIKDLYTKELRRLTPLEKKERDPCKDITPEIISEWAAQICESVFKEEESLSSDGQGASYD